MEGIALREDLFFFCFFVFLFFYQVKIRDIYTDQGRNGLAFVQSCVGGYRDEKLKNRDTDYIWTIFLYTVLNVVVINMMECYY